MKKVEKGLTGYLDYKKKVEIIRTILYFGIVACIFLLGYTQTKTKLNMLTVVAAVGCLPASKALVGVIARFPYASFDMDKTEEIIGKAPNITLCFDMIITSKESIMPVDCVAISGHNVYGYTHYDKVDTQALEKHMKSILSDNKYTGMTVKVLNQYTPFIARLEGLENILQVTGERDEKKEEAIRRLILNISM